MANLVVTVTAVIITIVFVLSLMDSLFGQPRNGSGQYQPWRVDQFIGLLVIAFSLALATYIYLSF